MKKMDTLATILGILVLIFSFVLGFVVDSNYWYVSATEQNFHDMENIAYSIMSESTEAPSGYSILNEGNKTLTEIFPVIWKWVCAEEADAISKEGDR